MAGKTSVINKAKVAPMKPENRRQIPLTAFTLLTVPEESMLSAYLKSTKHVDVSLARRMAGSTQEQLSCVWSSSIEDQSCSDSSTNKGMSTSDLDLELDKFMACLTANESPDTVIKTIVGTKISNFSPK